MPSEGHEGLRAILAFLMVLGLIFAVRWAWRHWSQSWRLQIGDPKPIKPIKPLQAWQGLKDFTRSVFEGFGVGVLAYLIVDADDFFSPREQLAWAAVGVLVLAVTGYRGLRKRLDGILHELREIRTPSEGKDYRRVPDAD
jgi:hypothetical protein